MRLNKYSGFKPSYSSEVTPRQSSQLTRLIVILPCSSRRYSHNTLYIRLSPTGYSLLSVCISYLFRSSPLYIDIFYFFTRNLSRKNAEINSSAFLFILLNISVSISLTQAFFCVISWSSSVLISFVPYSP